MIARILIPLITLTAAAALAPSASAQFGREEVARPDAKELYADRAMKNGWYDDAMENYTNACNDKTRQKAVWARNCRKLADMYRMGKGTQQDYSRAGSLYEEACYDGRDAKSCRQQAYLKFEGVGSDKDLPDARKLYKQGCELDDQTSCGGYGSMLYRGQGGEMKRDEGKRYIQEACDAGDEWSCERARGFGLPDRKGL
ncbi:tetratricopeptide repeat protein [Henriciella aquimarina]|uniref:tetratricopeptide repeat protein n=1 Tax=Henriciella aquimarina TaxID=545261 RepID=UPI000A03DC88|nr:tetratricopeptide repeat protein [Henriciella aquimarina]